MAKSELDIQTELKNAVIRSFAGHSYKQSNRMLVGVLDLYIKVPGSDAISLEVKQEDLKPGTQIIHIETSALQEHNMQRIRKAGGRAGWIMVAQKTSTKWRGTTKGYLVLIGDEEDYPEYRLDVCGLKMPNDVFERYSTFIPQREEPWKKMIELVLAHPSLKSID